MKPVDGLLIAGVVAGITLALVGLVDTANAPLDDATAAMVNDVPIPANELRSLLERRAQGGAPVDQLLGTLDDMIDEELLIQRASELGILRRDSNVRVAIIQAMEKSILNEARGRAVNDAELRAFYRDNEALFSEPQTYRLEELLITDPERLPPVTTALAEGESARALAAESDTVSLTRLPPVPLSLDALARRFPDEVITRLEAAREEDVLSYESNRGTHLIHVTAVLAAQSPSFEKARVRVLNELQLQRQDLAYEEYLAWLRQRAEIRTNERLAR